MKRPILPGRLTLVVILSLSVLPGAFSQMRREPNSQRSLATREARTPAADGAPIASITIIDPDTNEATKEIAVNVGNSVRPRLRILDTSGVERTDFVLTFSSLNTDVATVGPSGTVFGVKAGFSTLTISSGGVVATGTITVAEVEAGAGTGYQVNGIGQDRAGRVYLANSGDHTILLAQELSEPPQVYAGVSGTPGFQNEVRLKALFRNPGFLAFHQGTGVLYVTDVSNHVIRRIDPGPEGRVETFAGTTSAGSLDGTGEAASFRNPQGLALDGRGYLWVVDSGNHTIRRINLATRVVETVAGRAGTAGSADGVGSDARFNTPIGIALETESLANQLAREARQEPPPQTSMIVADTGNNLLRRVTEDGKVETLAQSPAAFFRDFSAVKSTGTSTPAAAKFQLPLGVAVDSFGNLYVTEAGSGNVRVVLPNGTIVGAIESKTFTSPRGITITQAGKLLVADAGNVSREISYGAPRIASASPRTIGIKGGEEITIQGQNFAPDSIVVVANTIVSQLQVKDTKTIVFTAPSLPSGRITLSVQNRGGVAQTSLDVEAVPLKQLPTGHITTVAGGSTFSGDGTSAASASLSLPGKVAVNSEGDVYISDTSDNLIRKVDARTGVITSVAGNGQAGFAGDGLLATAASLDYQYGIAVDLANNLYIADTFNNRIRKVDARTGIITTVAGNGTEGYSGDGGPATGAALYWPFGIAVDRSGNLYIADTNNDRIRKVDVETKIITTVAGNGQYGFAGENVLATSASLAGPFSIAVDKEGNLYIADTDNNRIRKVTAATKIISTVAGTGSYGSFGDGGPATSAQLAFPHGVGVDGKGDLYIVDTYNHRIRGVSATTRVISSIAGIGNYGFSGDGGTAVGAQLGFPYGVAIDSAGNVFIGDRSNNRVRRIDAKTKIITTLAGNGERGVAGNNGPAPFAQLGYPWRVALDAGDNIYITDTNNNRIRKVDAITGQIAAVAGDGQYGFSGDNKLATSSSLAWPFGVAVDDASNLYIADRNNHRIRKVEAETRLITTVAGNGIRGKTGDGGSATSARLNNPFAVAVDAVGNIFIADSWNDVIRRVDATTRIISTYAGNYSYGFSGDNGLATAAQLYYPQDLALDTSGNLYIADSWNNRIRRVDAKTGIITTVAGNGTAGFRGDGGLATSAQLSYPSGVTVHPDGTLLISDTFNLRVRKVDPRTKIITTIAGNGLESFAGDNGPGTSAKLRYPIGVAVAGIGDLHISDTSNSRIRGVRQAAASFCKYSIQPTSRTHGPDIAAGTISLLAPASCSWTAKSNVPWITVTIGLSGTGSGSVGYRLERNSGTTSRTGSITIGGKTLTITQEGTGSNDNFANAARISALPYKHQGYTATATTEPLDPTPECGGGSRARSAWYRLTAATVVNVTADTFGSDYNTVLSTFTGTSGALQAVSGGCSDDSNNTSQSQVSFTTKIGTTYYFMITSRTGEGGNLVFNVNSNLGMSFSLGVFRDSEFYLDRNGNNKFDDCSVDRCFKIGLAGDLPITGDWNGSGFTKVGVFRDGIFYLDYNGDGAFTNCTTDQCIQFGLKGDLPVAGDWNGSGTTKIGVFRNGVFYLDYDGDFVFSDCTKDRCVSLGLTGDLPVAGDWNGSGRAKIGVFRRGIFYLDNDGDYKFSDCVVDKCIEFGLSGDLPVAGDWDGSGFTKIGVRRGADFYLDRNGDGRFSDCTVDRCIRFGVSGDLPLAGRWGLVTPSAILELESGANAGADSLISQGAAEMEFETYATGFKPGDILQISKWRVPSGSASKNRTDWRMWIEAPDGRRIPVIHADEVLGVESFDGFEFSDGYLPFMSFSEELPEGEWRIGSQFIDHVTGEILARHSHRFTLTHTGSAKAAPRLVALSDRQLEELVYQSLRFWEFISDNLLEVPPEFPITQFRGSRDDFRK